MASVYQDKEPDKDRNAGTVLAKSGSGGTSAGSGSTQGTTLASSGNRNADRVAQLAQNSVLSYTPSDSVTAAKDYLEKVISNKPGSFNGKYTSQVEDVYNRIMNREKFNYDLNADAMYQNYSQRYRQLGTKSMRDTMGQASAQTGGYGNSYAQTAGRSAYDSYMSQLSEKIPELQQSALDRYNTETQNLQNLYSTATSADNTEYSRWNDSMSRWQSERDYAASEYDRAYSNDYQAHQGSISNAVNIIQLDRQDEQNAQANAQTQVQTLIAAGIMPGADLIAASGWDANGIAELVKKNR